MHLSRRFRIVAAATLVLALLASSCSSSSEVGDPGDPDETSTSTPGSTSDPESTEGSAGAIVRIDGGPGQAGDTEIIINLENAVVGDDLPPRETTLDGDPLSAGETDTLLDRLPDLDTETTDQVGFSRPPETRPRPTSATVVDQVFPPAADSDGPPDVAQDEPLNVLRFQPEGPVDLAPFISITFDQPMVALSTVDQVEQADIPVSIAPAMPGRWIWLGTRTLRFEYEPGAIDRIPAATTYVVDVPAGTRSANGNELGEGVRFSFFTPTPQVLEITPISTSLATDQLLFVRFDQRIDAQDVLETITLEANGRLVDLRLASGEEIEGDPQIERLTQNALPERWLAFRAVEPLPTDAALELEIGPNVPSAEGPKTSPDVTERDAQTYGPFRVESSDCGFGGDCTPGSPFRIRMSNPIDTESFTAELVTVEPPIPGMQISVNSNEVFVQGFTTGRTEYLVTLSGDLTDVFGQELGDEATERFRVGDAPPAIFRPGRSLVTLDPILDDRVLNVTSLNNDKLKVTVYEVDPTRDWPTYIENGWRLTEDDEFESPWQEVASRTVDVGGDANSFAETAIDLSDELDDNGHAIVVVGPERRREEEWQNQPFAVWVQSTHLGLDAITDNRDAVAWVTDLRTGEPIEGARVTILSNDSATTDSDGVARVPLGRQSRGMVASADGETALIGDFWAEAFDRSDQQRWYVIDDRGLYKPGETAKIKGWIREADIDIPSRLTLPSDGAQVRWTATDGFGNPIGEGEAPLSPLGGFDLSLDLPENITLGSASLQLNTDGFDSSGSHFHELRVQEFRRPDFEVNATITADGPYFAGDPFIAEAEADYFAGGALAASQVEWTVTGQPGSYSPPNWPDFTFGIWEPWWRVSSFDRGFGEDFFFGESGTTEFFSATSDAAGKHGLSVDVATEGKQRPVSLQATATVTDVTRQSVSGSTSALIHPADLYVGLRGARTFVAQGERLDFDVLVTDLDGAVVSGVDVTVDSIRTEYVFENGEWVNADVADETCEISSGDAPVVCTFRPSEGGRYRIVATIQDASGRTNLTELTRWVSGGTRPASRRVDLEQLTLVPNAQEFAPGDTAEILVQSPFTDAHGLVVVSRGSISSTETFEFDAEGSAVVRIPISADDIPGIGVQLEVVGSAPRTIDGSADSSVPPRPAYAAGDITLDVPPQERELSVDVAPRLANLEPGAETQVDVAVAGPDGRPVEGAELVVIVVDEAVLSLTNYDLRDPLEAFYQQTGGRAQVFRGRSTLVLSDPATAGLGEGGDGDVATSLDDAGGAQDLVVEEAAGDLAAPAPQLESARAIGGQDGQPAIDLRTDFDALAVFEPDVTTDDDGRATVEVPLPDNLTRYRVMVVATAAADQAGTAESNITARLPVTVRPTPPRFANFGDVFEFPVIVQNVTDEALDVDVALRSTNLNLTGRDGTTVTVPANDRIEVRFDVAADQAGTARYQAVVASGTFSDAAEGSFPVYTPATSEAFATYGVIDSGSIAQPFEEPEGVFPQFGGLEISTSSTAVSALTDAVIYVNDYRYESSDAFASRIISIVALDDILQAFDVDQLPSPDELRSTVNNDIDRLSGLQNSDGGWSYWRRGRESIPYHTVQATHALVLGQQNGFIVSQDVLANAFAYLTNIEQFYPSYYSAQTRRAISAYALHVRDLAGDTDVDKATNVFRDAEAETQLDVAAWLWPVLAETEIDDEIERLFNNRVTETPNAATFATDYGEQAWVLLHSDRRTDAIVLNAFLTERPESDLVLKTLNGLLAARDRRGHWTNIQENSFVLLAGAAFFERFENVAPDFIAQAWLGDLYAVEQEFDGRSTDRNATLVPMAELVDVGTTDVVVAKDGPGRLYYRLGLRYAPDDLVLEPRDQGFVVQRSYEAIDDDSDVVQNDDGSWTVKAGARVRVTVAMVADSRRTHVALLDPIPAGFEIVNPALATSEPIPQADPSDESLWGFWWYQWFDHQNLRDDRAEAFSTWLGAGSYEYTYVTRATTPGTFVVPPSRAEQIYEPEVFGRSSSTTVTITDEP